ncbi:MAG TPA: hypothetical protein VEK08_16355 [Planctomycetota bacterium]|nr:hypothetical protein [Planctomycetota bacterium]
MLRSSIFSFESLSGFSPRMPATVLSVLALVLLLEGVMRFIPADKLMPGKSRQSEMRFLKKELLDKSPEPAVLLMGSSRIRRAVNPRLLDQQLGLPEHSTLNLGLASGRLFEALYFYRENYDKLKSAKLVVLGIDEWHLSTGWRLGSVYELNAPWSERFAMSGRLRNQLVLDGLFSMRLKMRLLPNAVAVALGIRKPESPGLTVTDDYQVLPKARKTLPADIDPRRFHETIGTFYENFAIHPVMEGHVEAIAKLVKESGGQLVLMQLPNRAAYQREIERLKKDEFEQHVAAMSALAKRLDVPWYLYRDPSECGLDELSFQDYGHMTPEGAKAFTRFVAPLFKQHLQRR